MLKKVFLALLLCYATQLWAEHISAYAVDVRVEQSGELAIKESITYDFETATKHGIFRDIPFTIKYKGSIKDLVLNGFSVQMDGRPVNWQQSVMDSAKAGRIIRLKIGSAGTYVTGKHLYTISYRVQKGVLPAAQNEYDDAIRWNIIGTGWSVRIENITANFHLPPSLNEKMIALSTYTGRYDETASNATTKWITPQHLQVKVPSLQPYEGATVELAYPADTLGQNGRENVKASFSEWFLAHWHWGALVGYLLYFYNTLKLHTGFEDRRSNAVRYAPPKGFSLLQSGLILDKFADNKDFAAAILELAQLGYLEIYHKSKKIDPLLKRIEKDTKGLTADQKYLLEKILFSGTNSFVLSKQSETKAKKLQKGFNHIDEALYSWSVMQGYMGENPQKTRNKFLTKSLLLLLPAFALLVYTFYLNYGIDMIFMLLFPIVFIGAGLGIALTQKGWSSKIIGLVFAVAGSAPAWSMLQSDMSLGELLTGPLGIFILLLLALFYTYKKIGKYTQKGAYAYKQLLGFKEFVARVKKDEIKRRLALDPLYLEKTLPYAILFDETKHWISFFPLLGVSSPDWYHGDLDDIDDFVSNVATTSTPPSNSGMSGGGGFAGGGGFSGGGGGGGGGGSW